MVEDELFSKLQSADLETRMAAVNRASSNPSKYAKHVAALISKFPDDACFILEHVDRFGDAIIPHLVSLAKSNDKKQIKVLAELGLAHFRKVVDKTILVDSIRCRSRYQCLACKALAWLGSDDVLPSLLEELRTTSPISEWDRLISLTDAIKTLGGEIPESESKRLLAEGPPLTKMIFDAKSTG